MCKSQSAEGPGSWTRGSSTRARPADQRCSASSQKEQKPLRCSCFRLTPPPKEKTKKTASCLLSFEVHAHASRGVHFITPLASLPRRMGEIYGNSPGSSSAGFPRGLSRQHLYSRHLLSGVKRERGKKSTTESKDVIPCAPYQRRALLRREAAAQLWWLHSTAPDESAAVQAPPPWRICRVPESRTRTSQRGSAAPSHSR